jgi:hypothetical protein
LTGFSPEHQSAGMFCFCFPVGQESGEFGFTLWLACGLIDLFGGIFIQVEKPLFRFAVFESRDEFPVGVTDCSPDAVATFGSPCKSALRNWVFVREMLDDVESV